MDFLLIYIMSSERIMKRPLYIYANNLTMGSGILKYLMDARTTVVGTIRMFIH